MEAVTTIILIIAFVIQIVVIIKFFQLASDVQELKNLLKELVIRQR